MGAREAAPQTQAKPGIGERIRRWRQRSKVDDCLDTPEKEAVKKLAKLKFLPLSYLVASVKKMDAKSAKAAYLIGKVAETGTDCNDALHPLYDLLMGGDDLGKANAAVALARIGTQEARSMLIAALNDRNHIIRRYAAVGLGITGDASAESALKKATESDPDREVRRLAENSIRQIAELQQP
ncbi:MAG: HEAT repeat domain-containing protein [Candidatus Micrarchaeota archaeon]|nr:HEAT repeat domain-containing protein [Candidatus Micrarchaeota archaeon]